MHTLLSSSPSGKDSVVFSSLPYSLPFPGADKRSVTEIMEAEGVTLERVCLLDPKAEKEIDVRDSEEFDWFLCALPTTGEGFSR